MNRTEPHPVELLLLSVLVVAVALVELVAAVVAMLQPSPSTSRSGDLLVDTPPAPPSVHPLAAIAAELEALPVARLRPMAGVRSKAIRKAQLIELVAVCC